LAGVGSTYPMIDRLSLVVRVMGAIFFGFLGLRSGQALAEGDTGLVQVLFWALTPIGFTLFGALTTPFLIMTPLQRLQAWSRTIPPLQLVLGTFGLIAGFLIGALATPFLLTLPGIGGWIAPFIVTFVLGIIGVVVMVGREEDLAGFLARYLPEGRVGAASSREVVVDTSVIIDGRIADIATTGFIEGDLIIPRFILDELRHIADSPEALRRNRGRRGLDVLNRLQKEAPLNVRVVDDDFPDARDVDAKLIRLAAKLNATILTNDFNLNRIAELDGLPVLNVNDLANAVKVVILPGEEMEVRIIQEGKELGQGVGFLDDGTMVVVEGGREHLNDEVDVTVTRVLQTVAGRMIFAQPKRAARPA
jgi:uncharacterized protein YacL